MVRSDASHVPLERSRPGRRGIAASAAVALVVFASAAGLPAHADGPTTFTNATSVAIPATGSANQLGPAGPYPSTLTVSGMTGLVTAVQVVFHGLTHSALNDVDAMVVAPSGANLVVLSDIGDPQTSLAFTSNATLTFADAAAGSVPIGNVPTGTYRPTNNGAPDAFAAPAPAPSAQTTLAGAFTGIDPNGAWQLFIVDDTSGDIGSMAGGWSLVITTEAAAVATTTVVTTSGSPSASGAPVTFTAAVTAGGNPVTTGTVAFTADGSPLGTVAVQPSGTAQLTTSGLAEGTHGIVGTYSGSTGFLTSNGSVSQRVDTATVVTGSTYCNPGGLTVPTNGPAVPYPSNITVSGLDAPISTVTATLDGVSHAVPVDLDVMLSGPVPTSNVMLMSDVGGTAPVTDATIVFDDAAAGSVPKPLAAGTFRPTDDDSDAADAAFPAPAPVAGSATTLAAFAGQNGNGVWSLWVVDDATGDAGSISGGWCLTFETFSSTDIALQSSANPSMVGQSVTFTANVTADGSPVTIGSVLFFDGATPLGASVAVDASGIATLTTDALTAGAHDISANYGGSPAHGISYGLLDQVVDLNATSTALASNANPSITGGAVTLTATVSAAGSPVTSGSVSFSDDGGTLASNVPVDGSGVATFTTSALTVGTHPISATYSGTAAYAASSADLSQVVDAQIVADAGGPYSVAEGAGLTLDGSGSTAGAAYAWDLDADGDFADASGAMPSLTWAQLDALGLDDGPSSHAVTLKVTLGDQEVIDTVALDITNTAPSTVIAGSLTGTAGVPFTVKVGAEDPSAADMAALFDYTVDWGDGSPIETVSGPADPPVTHVYVVAGVYSASMTSTDKDGGTGDPLTIQVVVDPADSTPSPSPTPTPLPPTGADSTGAALLAGVLILGGALLVGAASRRRRTHRS
ncbi:Ig-like domain repeat protein [Microbacterium sp. CFBP9034]|uniref:Ig-like domain repeat protein n=1 Tax=Microbacterium sp. CFBP9034 TaxID=3096540 RepID=UPI002A6A59BF|nr:Ig-like domain repeat protein [Microbacterium sp. CFBP9034]MDY0910054.1 Ig-like domain repeat protein [Microbacterium sp. CFBP9034]